MNYNLDFKLELCMIIARIIINAGILQETHITDGYTLIEQSINNSLRY